MAFEWHKLIGNIRFQLEESGYQLYSKQILGRQLEGMMYSEILLAVCSKLLEIKIKDEIAYKIIEINADSLIKYCYDNGLFAFPPGWRFVKQENDYFYFIDEKFGIRWSLYIPNDNYPETDTLSLIKLKKFPWE